LRVYLSINNYFVSVLDFTYYLAAPSLNILWQTIQYCLAGASEILFTATGQFHSSTTITVGQQVFLLIHERKQNQ